MTSLPMADVINWHTCPSLIYCLFDVPIKEIEYKGTETVELLMIIK